MGERGSSYRLGEIDGKESGRGRESLYKMGERESREGERELERE